MTIEQAPQPVVPEVPQVKDEQISPKFAALARQQKLQRQQQQEIAAREEALKAKDAEYQKNYIPKERLKTDLLSVLSEQGVSTDEFINQYLEQQKDPYSANIKKLQARIDELEAKTTKAQTDAQESQKKQYEQAVTQVRNEVLQLVDSDSTYETIKANEAQEAVVDLIRETFEKEGTLLKVEEAANQIEEYLLEQAVKMASLEKVKQKLTPKVEDPIKGAPMKPQIKTLTNTSTTVSAKPLTNRERRERAIAAFKGQLQQ